MQKRTKYLGDMSTSGLKRFARALDDFHKAGKVDPKEIFIYKVMVPAKPAEVRKVRKALDLDRASLADAIGVSADTVKGWEIGKRVPDGPVTKILRLLDTDPKLLLKFRAI